jgi:hypothetical protein
MIYWIISHLLFKALQVKEKIVLCWDYLIGQDPNVEKCVKHCKALMNRNVKKILTFQWNSLFSTRRRNKLYGKDILISITYFKM